MSKIKKIISKHENNFIITKLIIKYNPNNKAGNNYKKVYCSFIYIIINIILRIKTNMHKKLYLYIFAELKFLSY